MPRHPSRSRRGRKPERDAAPGATNGAWLRELVELGRDPARWAALDEDALLLIAFQQCLYYAHTQDAEAGAALADLYAELVRRVGETERIELLDRVVEAVEQGGTSVIALLPFLQHEPAPAAVAVAAVSLASLMPLAGGDELTGPRTLLRMAEHADDEGTRVGIASGLLQLGDRRTLPQARATWQLLSGEGRRRLVATRSASRPLFASTIEFWLDALEDADPATFAAVADLFARLPAEAEPKRVLDVERKFPANAPDGRDEITIVHDWSLADYAQELAPRLHDLARRENEPRRLHELIAGWGLAPE